MRSTPLLPALAATLTLSALPALAHTGEGIGGLASGFLHPVSGLDHIVAMVAVGLWGAILGAPALWLLPLAFPVAMALAGALGVMAVPLPFVEQGIALSGIVLGGMVLFAQRPPLALALAVVAVFAVFHGHAHGAELPEAANPVAYAVGFVVTTGLLHLAGIAIGTLAKWPAGLVAVRATGGVIALAGAAFLTGLA
ncbi:MAG: HupE/UreJ family protein [Gemmobacter sp.]